MNKDTSNAALAFIVGAVAGGITALLLAPASGAETREKIRKGLGSLRDQGKDLIQKGKETTSKHTSALRQAATAAKEAYREEIGQA